MNMNKDTGKYLIDPSVIERQKARVFERLKEVMEQRNEILEAFIAKYGCQPEEAEQVLQMMPDGTQVFSVRKRPNT